jgi:hypothetical protein
MASEDQSDSPVDVIPGYESDISAVGRNRTAESPDDGVDWTEVHELSADEAQALTKEAEDDPA